MLIEEIAEILIKNPKEIGKMLVDQGVTPEEVENAITIMREGIDYATSSVLLYKGLETLRSFRAGTGGDLEEALDLIKNA